MLIVNATETVRYRTVDCNRNQKYNGYSIYIKFQFLLLNIKIEKK